MKRLLFFALTLLVADVMAQHPVESKAYAWRKPESKTGMLIFSAALFEGSARDMAYIQMSANAMATTGSAIARVAPTAARRPRRASPAAKCWRVMAGAGAIIGITVPSLYPLFLSQQKSARKKT